MTVAGRSSLDGLARRLRLSLGDDAVIDDPQRRRTYECDGLAHHKVTPALVVLPDTPAAIATVVQACVAAGVPFVARGSGTGLSGGALPHAQGVLIVTSRLRRMVEIDAANQRATVEPGVVNLDLSKAAAPYGYHYAPILRANRSAPSVATWRRTPGAPTASSTASPPITSPASSG